MVCGKYADDQDQAPQHDRLFPKSLIVSLIVSRIMGRKAGIFKPKRLFPSAQWPLLTRTGVHPRIKSEDMLRLKTL